jgi:DNA polymerase I-like protein with 3'-5' exonuclease and polymerase domains
MSTISKLAAAITQQRQTITQQAEAYPRVLFCMHEQERTAASITKRWCLDNKVQGSIAFGKQNLEAVQKIIQLAKSKKQPFNMVVLSSRTLFRKVKTRTDGNQEEWRGSILTDVLTLPILITDSLITTQGFPKYKIDKAWHWIYEQDLNKIHTYRAPYKYRFSIVHSCAQADLAVQYLCHPANKILVVDIETNLNNYITSIAFTPITQNTWIGHTWVFPLTVLKHLQVYTQAVRTILAGPQEKCFHNGTFDTFHLFRHRAPVHNWIWDTEYMWYCWRPETKLSLAFVSSIALPDYIFWKKEAEEHPLEYNAKDTINTARSLLWLIDKMPSWAWRNYAQLLPKLIPTVACNLEGFATDQQRYPVAQAAAQQQVEQLQKDLEQLTGKQGLNFNSPKQLQILFYDVLAPTLRIKKPSTKAGKMKAAAGKNYTATDSTSLKAYALQHPVVARIADTLLEYRKQAKALSTYYEAHLTHETNRLYYNYNVDGTVSGRDSCGASTLRLVIGTNDKGQIRKKDIVQYGTQIQNAPPYYKQILAADKGYLIASIDKVRAEAFCVALIFKDKAFAKAVSSTERDFYLYLAELFFGICTEDKKHPIRQVCKKINHGSSYCMGWEVFLDSVGLLKIYQYMDLVGWTGPKSPQVFINHLLNDLYHGAFPNIKRGWIATTAQIIKTQGLLTTPDGWTRHTFIVPKNINAILPPLVAHQPQHLSVAAISRALWQLFYELQLPSQGAFRLKGNVHDSIVFQFKEDKPEYVDQAKEIMERPWVLASGDILQIPCEIDIIAKTWKVPADEV